MKAIIIAGGRGERLLPLTADRPKCMVEALGKSIAVRQLEWLATQGVDEAIFSCGYRWDVIRHTVGDGLWLGLTVRYAVEDQPLGRGGGLRKALLLLDTAEPLVAMNGDVLARPDLAAMVAQHQQSGAVATVMVVPYVSDDALVDVGAGNRITGFREKPRLPFWINGGIYILSPAIVELLPEVGDHESLTFPQLAEEGRLHAFPFEGDWVSVDSAKDLSTAEQFLSR